jgi:hypothetical protein
VSTDFLLTDGEGCLYSVAEGCVRVPSRRRGDVVGDDRSHIPGDAPIKRLDHRDLVAAVTLLRGGIGQRRVDDAVGIDLR